MLTVQLASLCGQWKVHPALPCWSKQNIRQMRVTGVLSLAPMRLSVSWKLHDAFIRNEFLPFLWGLLSSNVYTSPLLPSVFGDLDLQHLLVDWIDAKRTNPLKKKKDRKQLCKAKKVVFSFSKAPRETRRKHYCSLSSRVCFSYLVFFDAGKPPWFCLEMLPLNITATELRGLWAGTALLQH